VDKRGDVASIHGCNPNALKLKAKLTPRQHIYRCL
jgi:hypothetical protein